MVKPRLVIRRNILALSASTSPTTERWPFIRAQSISAVIEIINKTGYTTFPVTEKLAYQKFLGICATVTGKQWTVFAGAIVVNLFGD